MYLVSACLAGFSCRYDGKIKPNESIIEMVKNGKAIPFCPEQAGGLATPRPPCEMQGNATAILKGDAKIISKDGKDCTKEFVLGAQEALRLCKLYCIKEAILKSKSPSCGDKEVYDGSFKGTLIEGRGICAQLLQDNGIKIQTI